MAGNAPAGPKSLVSTGWTTVFVPGPRPGYRPLPGTGPHMRLLDGARPDVAHAADRVLRVRAELHQQTGGDGPGGAPPPPAVDEYVEPQAKPVPKRLAVYRPLPLEIGSRYRPVDHRQVQPLHLPVGDRLAETADPEALDLLPGDHRDHRGRSPVADRSSRGTA